MPYHHVPMGTLFEDIRSLEREGEIVVQALNDENSKDSTGRPTHVHVFTRWVGTPPLETRPAAPALPIVERRT